jgi:SAM-dependent methyltransferase
MTHAAKPPDSAPSEQVDRFNAMYDAGAPPWDIGRPQPAFLELAERDLLTGRVLDVGCGTGEHALMAAARRLDATGIDAVPRAISIAQRKAQDRGLTARFVVWDAMRLPDLGEQFDTVLDSGLFHVFDDDDRLRFVAALAAVVPSGGRYYMLCFSDRQPGTLGPRRIKQSEIR